MEKFDMMPKNDLRAFDKLMHELRLILVDGITHGFFAGTISVTATRADRREVLISAGKTHKYTIKMDDLPR
jgi:hypothetical protein